MEPKVIEENPRRHVGKRLVAGLAALALGVSLAGCSLVRGIFHQAENPTIRHLPSRMQEVWELGARAGRYGAEMGGGVHVVVEAEKRTISRQVTESGRTSTYRQTIHHQPGAFDDGQFSQAEAKEVECYAHVAKQSLDGAATYQEGKSIWQRGPTEEWAVKIIGQNTLRSMSGGEIDPCEVVAEALAS